VRGLGRVGLLGLLGLCGLGGLCGLVCLLSGRGVARVLVALGGLLALRVAVRDGRLRPGGVAGRVAVLLRRGNRSERPQRTQGHEPDDAEERQQHQPGEQVLQRGAQVAVGELAAGDGEREPGEHADQPEERGERDLDQRHQRDDAGHRHRRPHVCRDQDGHRQRDHLRQADEVGERRVRALGEATAEVVEHEEQAGERQQ
jgi:hypothetical protein